MSAFDLLSAALPDVAVEISSTAVSAARIVWRGGQATVAAHASEALPPGAVHPALAASNMPDVGAVGKVVTSVLSQLGGRAPRVALVVPDMVAKVSIIRLERVPAKDVDLREIVRWQVRKSAPFPIEQAVMSISPGAPGSESGRDFVVSLAREDVIRQYEQACAMAGAHAGIVDLSTFCVLNGVVAGAGAPAGDWLLVHAADASITVAVIRGEHLIFYRHRGEESEGTLSDLIHQTAMYYEDRLSGTGFARAWLAGAGRRADAADVMRDLETRLGMQVHLVDPSVAPGLAERGATSPELADVLAPLVGVLRREPRAA